MNNLFTETEFDSIIGTTIRETYLNGEDLYSGLSLEEVALLKEQLFSEINNQLIWYYLACESIKRKGHNNVSSNNNDDNITNDYGRNI